MRVTRAGWASSQLPTRGSNALLVNAPANCSVAAPWLAVNDALPTHAPAIAGVPSYVALPAGVPSSL